MMFTTDSASEVGSTRGRENRKGIIQQLVALHMFLLKGKYRTFLIRQNKKDSGRGTGRELEGFGPI